MLTLIKIVCKTATLFFNLFISESQTLINFWGLSYYMYILKGKTFYNDKYSLKNAHIHQMEGREENLEKSKQ